MTTYYLELHQCNVTNKRVLLRQDLNVSSIDGRLESTLRLEAALPTLKDLMNRKASTLLLSHLGNPTEGQFDPSYSLQPIADYLSKRLNCHIPLIRSLDDVQTIEPGTVSLLENVRFNLGEKKNDPALIQRYAAQADLFVMDSFGTAHRAHASTEGIIAAAPTTCIGPLFLAELKTIQRLLDKKEHPFVALIAGSKISTKLRSLDHLAQQVDTLIVGGGLANTLLMAAGYAIGQSLVEHDNLKKAKALLEYKNLMLPIDVVLQGEAGMRVASVDDIRPDEKIYDLGPQSLSAAIEKIQQARTVFWNGPVGLYEQPAFAHGTQTLARAIANASCFSVVGGGNTIAALETYKIATEHFSYISTGGGAFLYCLEDASTLPSLIALEKHASIDSTLPTTTFGDHSWH